MELKVKCQNDHKMDNYNIELVEQIHDTKVKQTLEAINEDISSEFPEMNLRESFNESHYYESHFGTTVVC